MRKLLAISFSCFVAAGALAQTTSHTYHMNHVPSTAALNEIATLLRALVFDGRYTDTTPPVSVDPADQSITVSGTADQQATANWIIQHLDVTAPPQNTQQYTAGESDPAVRIYFLAHTHAQAPLNELVTVMRTVGDIQRIFTYPPLNAVGIRTTTGKAQFADWMVQQMDVSPTSRPVTARHDLPLPACGDAQAEVRFLTNVGSQIGVNELVTILRAVADIQMIFTHSSEPLGIAFRSCPSTLELGDWLIQQTDVAPGSRSNSDKYEYQVPNSVDPVVRVYYLKGNDAAEYKTCVTAIRDAAKVSHIFYSLTTGAVALRGTPDQIAVADQVIRQYDR